MANEVEKPKARSLITIVDEILEPIRDNLVANLMDSAVKPERFRAVLLNAVAKNQDILKCDGRSLQVAVLMCAQDGLIPDGKLAALVPYKNRKKGGILEATYTPMVQGIISRARELGDVFSVTAACVYANDFWDCNDADPDHTIHKRAPFGQERGEVVAAYCIFRDNNRVVLHREVMDRRMIDKIRAKSSKADGSFWNEWFEEMARKTVVRRGSKYLSKISEKLRTIIEREDRDYSAALEPPGREERQSHNPLLEEPDDEVAPRDIGDTDDDEVLIDPETGEILDNGDVDETEPDAQKPPAEKPKAEATMDAGAAKLLAEIAKALGEADTVSQVSALAEEFAGSLERASQATRKAADKMMRDRQDAIRRAPK